jgi:uncharacterized protein involved in response to NO
VNRSQGLSVLAEATGMPTARRGVGPGSALWGRGFRPFFLLGTVYAALVVPFWLAIYAGLLAPPRWLTPFAWHGHEMLFGFAAAAIAGFLLTAVPVWTGTPAVHGRSLAALVGVWLLGRVAMLAAGVLPPLLVATLDLLFLPMLAAALAPALAGPGQRRNAGFVPVLLALFVANLAVHGEALGVARAGAASRALRVALDLVVVLITVVGGRITPAFTRNALLRAGASAEVRSRPALDRLAVASVAGLALADALSPRGAVSGGIAALAALASAGRLVGWQSRRVLRWPLVVSLHLGMAWVALGLGLVALGDLSGLAPPTAGLHALTAGAMGAMILAVVTRVGLGHTGRPLELPRGVPAAYALVNAGALLRVAAPFLAPALQLPVLAAGGAAWAAAFAVFALVYAPILTSPRVDGAPG